MPYICLDTASSNGTSVSGWAFDPNAKGVPLNIGFIVDNTDIGCQPSTVLRTDINGGWGTTGNHGFSYSLVDLMQEAGKTLSAGKHTVEVYTWDANMQGRVAATLTQTIDIPVVSAQAPYTNGSYDAGSPGSPTVLPISVTFDNPVAVTGTPTLTLQTGHGNGTVVSYSSGSGSNTLIFNYTVANGDNNAALDYMSTTALSLNGGTITDTVRNMAANIVLPPPGNPGSLSGSARIVIDTIAPVAPALTSISPGEQNPQDSTNFVTASKDLVLSGTGEPGASIYLGNQEIATVAPYGTWAAGGDFPYTSGTEGYVLDQMDAAGNTSSNNTTYWLTINTTATTWASTTSPIAGLANEPTQESDWQPGVALTAVRMADVDGDGQVEFVGVDSSGNWWVGKPNGAGSFTTTLWATVSGSSVWQNIQVADFNGDGMADVAGCDASGTWHVMTSTGGSFASPEIWGNPGCNFGNIQVADFNGDHRMDLFGTDGNGNYIVGVASGSGFSFQNWGNAALPLCVVGDFDGDGRADVASVDNQGNWTVGLSTGNGFQFHSWGKSPNVPSKFYAADINGDGKIDIVGPDGDGANWTVLISNGSSFASYTVPMLDGNSSQVTLTQVTLADVNGDGAAELVGNLSGSNDWYAEAWNSTSHSFTGQKWVSTEPVATSNGLWLANYAGLMRKALADFQYVYDTIAYTPYAGSMKGATGAQASGSANDWDQAALLISKLQADGIQAQFAYGRVAPQLTDLKAWLGTSDPQSTLNVLTQAGLNPVSGMDVNGQATYVFDHAWVQAYLPGSSGFAWQNLDPSWKYQSTNTSVMDVLNTVNCTPL